MSITRRVILFVCLGMQVYVMYFFILQSVIVKVKDGCHNKENNMRTINLLMTKNAALQQAIKNLSQKSLSSVSVFVSDYRGLLLQILKNNNCVIRKIDLVGHRMQLNIYATYFDFMNFLKICGGFNVNIDNFIMQYMGSRTSLQINFCVTV